MKMIGNKKNVKIMIKNYRGTRKPVMTTIMMENIMKMIKCIRESECHNPSLGFATKAKVCKGAGQEECERV